MVSFKEQKFVTLTKLNLSVCSFSKRQGSPTPGPRTVSGPQPVRNRAAQQEVSGGPASEASSAAPHCSPLLTLPPEPPSLSHPPPVHGKITFHETSPWCQKGWGPLLYHICVLQIFSPSLCLVFSFS